MVWTGIQFLNYTIPNSAVFWVFNPYVLSRNEFFNLRFGFLGSLLFPPRETTEPEVDSPGTVD